MASADNMGSKRSKQRIVRKSLTAVANKKNWLSRIFPFLGPHVDSSRKKQVKRRLLFEKGTADEEGRVALTSDDFVTADENIKEIVDEDESDMEDLISSRLLPDFLCSIWFRAAVYIFIIFNAIIIGLETADWFSKDYAIFIEIVKELALAFFVCEILLKWFCGFWIFWRSNWNIIDFVVVALAVIGPEYHFMSCGRILRLLRGAFVLGAVAAIDKFGIFKGLTIIIESLLISLPEMINIGLLLLFILLILAVAAKSLLDVAVPEYYGNLGSAFFNLFLLTTQDGLVIQYKKFELQGLWIRSVGAIIYVLAIMTGAFIFVNIIVAISCYNLEVACAAEVKDDSNVEDEENGFLDRDLTEDSADDPAVEFLEKLQFISKSKGHRGLNLAQLQRPFQLTNFSNLTVAKLEKYLLLLSALEENFAEYEDIKHDLEELYDLVKNLNLLDVYQGAEFNPSDQVEQPTSGKASIGSATKGTKGPDQEVRHLVDMLKRSSQRGQVFPSGSSGDERSPRSSASSETSQQRKLLSPFDALHPTAAAAATAPATRKQQQPRMNPAAPPTQ